MFPEITGIEIAYREKRTTGSSVSPDRTTLPFSSSFHYSAENLIALSDNSSADVSPYRTSVDKVNYIGGQNWNNPEDAISRHRARTFSLIGVNITAELNNRITDSLMPYLIVVYNSL